MPKRRLPPRPDIEFLKREAKELLTDYRREKKAAVADFGEYHPSGVRPRAASLSDAQAVLARSYRFPNWSRMVSAANLCRAIYDSDLASLRQLLRANPRLLEEPLRGFDTGASWGTPFAAAQFLGRTDVVDELARSSGLEFEELTQQADSVARQQLHDWFVSEQGVKRGAVMNPCETLNASGLRYLVEAGADLTDAAGDPLAPLATILQTYTRFPAGKHDCLRICEECGSELPDTPMMAFHRGRIDLLEAHLQRDRGLLSRCFSHEEIYPAALGCGSRSSGHGLHGTPLQGTTLLHLSVDFDETEIAKWLVEKGADVNAAAAVQEDGFGGHTPLFGTVVSQPALNGRQPTAQMARWLLSQGANPNVRASLRKSIRFHGDRTAYEYRDVTPLGWGRQFHSSALVSKAAMEVIIEHGGVE